MPTIVQALGAGADAAATSKSVTLTQPDAGNMIVVFGGRWSTATPDGESITAPSGTTERAENASGGNWGVVAADKVATGSGETTCTVTAISSDPLCVCAVNLSGAGALTTKGTANSAETAQDGLTITAEGAVAADNSLALAVFYRRGKLNGGNTSYTATGWTEEVKVWQGSSPADEAEFVLLSKVVNVADGTVSCVVSDTASDSNHAGIILIYPPDNVAPVITNPGTQYAAKGVARTLGVSVADSNSSLSTFRAQCAEAKGDLGVTLQGSVTVSAGANNSHDLTISGGIYADLIAVAATLTYTSLLTTGTDTVTCTADDGVATDVENISVVLCKAIVEADTQADLNATLPSGQLTSSTAQTITATIIGEDSGGRQDTEVVTFTIEDVSTRLEEIMRMIRRRRRRWI